MSRCKKYRYRNRLEARIALARIRRKGAKQETQVYYCDDCQALHLTSQEKR